MLFVDGIAVWHRGLSFVCSNYLRVPSDVEWIARVGTIIQIGSRRCRVVCIVRAPSEAAFLRAMKLVHQKSHGDCTLFVLVQEAP